MSTQFQAPLAGPDPPLGESAATSTAAFTAALPSGSPPDQPGPAAPGTDPALSAQHRWSSRLQELAAAQVGVAEKEAPDKRAVQAEKRGQAPEPIQWRERPPLWQRVKRGVAVPVAAAAVVFLAILLFSIITVWMQPHGAEASSDATLGSTLSTAANGGADSLAGDTAGSGLVAGAASGAGAGAGLGASVGPGQNASVTVHVIGEVSTPGVYELPAGSRALAAIEAAGGASETAVLAALNLARLLNDGEQLLVPNAEQVAAAGGIGGPGFAGSAGVASGIAGSSGAAAGAPGQLVNLNAADLSALESLPHIGPSLAARIIDWRSSNGGFRSIDQLLEVSGIGQKTFEDIRAHVTV